MKAQNRNAKKGVKRRRTGCAGCKASHTKCDETKPICGRCKRLALDCAPSDFIIRTAWSQQPAVSPDPSLSNEQAPPKSTWDLFSSRYRVIPVAKPKLGADLPPTLDIERVTLLREFQTGVGSWVGIFDDQFQIERNLPKLALRSGLLLNAICAVTAKQMSGTTDGQVWTLAAVHYYGEALHLLIQTLGTPSYIPEHALIATVLLSSYELLDSPGLDHRRHVCGALTLIRKHDIKGPLTGLRKAAFWVYARQDVSIALAHECPAMLPPGEWEVNWAENESSDEMLGNKMIWLTAKVIERVFAYHGNSSGQDNWRGSMREELDRWYSSLPDPFRGVTFDSTADDGFSKLYFVVSSSAAAMSFYHLSRLLLLIADCESDPSLKNILQPEINKQAQAIANIGFSPISDIALIHVVQPIYYAAQHIDSFEKKVRLWTLLDRIEVQTGFHTGLEVQKLRDQASAIYEKGLKIS